MRNPFVKNKREDNKYFLKRSLRRTVTNVLSLTVLLCIIGSIFLGIQGKATPDLVRNLGTSASGALIAFLCERDFR